MTSSYELKCLMDDYRANMKHSSQEYKEAHFFSLTVGLMMHKYLYYQKACPIISDAEYDRMERYWRAAGIVLNLISPEQCSPCNEFDKSVWEGLVNA